MTSNAQSDPGNSQGQTSEVISWVDPRLEETAKLRRERDYYRAALELIAQSTKTALALDELPAGFHWEFREGEDGGGSQSVGPHGERRSESWPATLYRRAVGPWQVVRRGGPNGVAA